MDRKTLGRPGSRESPRDRLHRPVLWAQTVLDTLPVPLHYYGFYYLLVWISSIDPMCLLLPQRSDVPDRNIPRVSHAQGMCSSLAIQDGRCRKSYGYHCISKLLTFLGFTQWGVLPYSFSCTLSVFKSQLAKDVTCVFRDHWFRV